METLVIGHRNPDMDAICSAIAYAELKKALGERGVYAARCGSINERIEYALERFGFEAPVFFSDVRPQVRDVMETNVVKAMLDEPVYSVFSRLGERRIRGLPVVDGAGRCVGLLSSLKISRHVIPEAGRGPSLREVHTSLDAIIRTTGAEVLVGEADSVLQNYVLLVVAMQTETFRKRLEGMDRSRTILIVGDRRNIQRLAIEAGVKALLLTNQTRIDEDLRELAQRGGTLVLSSPWDTATTVLMARSSVHVNDLLEEEVMQLRPEMILQQVQAEVAMSSQVVFPVVSGEGLLVGILSKSDFLKPVPRRLILVDHNELVQAVNGASNLPVVEILDHHRIGAPPTQQPILFINRPVGSTCSIVADCYDREGVRIPSQIAGILMCGLISDTLNLTSPTTTPFDRDLMEKLAKLAGVHPGELAESIFSVGSPLLTMSADQAITADSKEYHEGGWRFFVAQIEELTFAHFAERQRVLLEALEARRVAAGYDFAALLVTDINTQNSYLLMQGAREFLRLVDYPCLEEGVWWLEGVVSRKKQLIPYLCSLAARVTKQVGS